jgi:hypothetical protein
MHDNSWRLSTNEILIYICGFLHVFRVYYCLFLYHSFIFDSVDPSNLCWGCVNNGWPRSDKDSRQKSSRCYCWECSRYIWRRLAVQRRCLLAQETKYGWPTVKKHCTISSYSSSLAEAKISEHSIANNSVGFQSNVYDLFLCGH